LKKQTYLKFLIIFFFLIFSHTESYSQKASSKEIGLLSDNDLYTSTYRDRYYTNGTAFYYRFVVENSEKLLKKINSFEIGQKMFTPNRMNIKKLENQDRPYAGYSYVNFSNQLFFKNNNALKITFEISVIGEAAKARDLQNFIHDIYGFERNSGWDTQIEAGINGNINASYLKSFQKEKAKIMDLSFKNSVELGTAFTNVSSSIYCRLNLSKKELQPMSNSILFESNLNLDPSIAQKELFLFVKPKGLIQFYDATLQGGLFYDNSPLTYKPKPFVFEIESGICYSTNRFNLKYSIVTYSKKNSELIDDSHTYGTLQIAYKFN
jgi:lipid A 3-O-deacylase